MTTNNYQRLRSNYIVSLWSETRPYVIRQVLTGLFLYLVDAASELTLGDRDFGCGNGKGKGYERVSLTSHAPRRKTVAPHVDLYQARR